MMQTQINIQDLLAKLELPLNALDGLQEAGSVSVAQKTLNAFKQLVKSQKKCLAKKHHPDKGGNEERMKEINNICDWILGSKIEMIPIQPVVRYYSYSYFASSGTSANSTGTTFCY